MPAITVTSPGATIGSFTAAAGAVTQDFLLSGRANALLGMVGTQPWKYSTDAVNFVSIAAGQTWILPLLTGQNSTVTITMQRDGASDSVVSCWVAG